jgi:hypothetical protein
MSGALTTGLASPIEIVWLLYNSSHVFDLENFMQYAKSKTQSTVFATFELFFYFFIFRIFRKLRGSLPPYLIYARRRRVDWGNTCPSTLHNPIHHSRQTEQAFRQTEEKNTPLHSPLLEYVATLVYLTVEPCIVYVQKLDHKIFVRCIILNCGGTYSGGKLPRYHM